MGSKVLLGDVVQLDDSRRQPLSSRQREGRKGCYPYYGAQGIVDYLDDYTYDGTYLLVAGDGENLRSRKMPSIDEQQSIMAILGSIDNKIALNQQTNDYLAA